MKVSTSEMCFKSLARLIFKALRIRQDTTARTPKMAQQPKLLEILGAGYH